MLSEPIDLYFLMILAAMAGGFISSNLQILENRFYELGQFDQKYGFAQFGLNPPLIYYSPGQ
jgi:hypothetical protein